MAKLLTLSWGRKRDRIGKSCRPVPLTIAHFVTVAKSIGPYALHGWIIVDSFITYVGVHLGISTGGVALGAAHGAGAVASAESVLSSSDLMPITKGGAGSWPLATSPTTAGEWGGTTSVWSFSGPERRPNAAKILSGRGLVCLRVGAPPILVLGD